MYEPNEKWKPKKHLDQQLLLFKYSHFISFFHKSAVQVLELQQVEAQRLRAGLPPGQGKFI